MGRTCAGRLVEGQETHKCGQDSGLGGARAWWGQVSCVGTDSLMKGWGSEPQLNPLEEATRKPLVDSDHREEGLGEQEEVRGCRHRWARSAPGEEHGLQRPGHPDSPHACA